ncbi:hypothetical protein ACLB2K_069347 [Fragaria x ananassa]
MGLACDDQIMTWAWVLRLLLSLSRIVCFVVSIETDMVQLFLKAAVSLRNFTKLKWSHRRKVTHKFKKEMLMIFSRSFLRDPRHRSKETAYVTSNPLDLIDLAFQKRSQKPPKPLNIETTAPPPLSTAIRKGPPSSSHHFEATLTSLIRNNNKKPTQIGKPDSGKPTPPRTHRSCEPLLQRTSNLTPPLLLDE